MSKIAFIYPGQGAQAVGMGADFYEKSPLSKAVFDQAYTGGNGNRLSCDDQSSRIHGTSC